MSEQTPDTNDGMTDGQDPSMEDILASIRKIIADDDVQGAALAEPEAVDIITEPNPVQGDVTELAHVDTLDLDILADDVPAIDPDIEALIGDMDVEAPAALEIPQIQATDISDDVMDDVLDLEIPFDEPEMDTPEAVALDVPEVVVAEEPAIDEMMDLTSSESLEVTAEQPMALTDELDDLLADMDDDIVTPIETPEAPKTSNGLMGGAMAALGLGGAAAAAKALVSDAVEPPEDDLSLMLDNMLEDSASYQEAPIDEVVAEERVIDPAEELLAELDLSEAAESEEVAHDTPASDPDMDLVKSLMADLTEEPLHDETDAEAALDIDAADDANTDDVMDEILTMTLDDETKLSEDIAIPEFEAPEIELEKSEPLSLKEIAAQADADAQSSSSLLGKGLAAAAGVGVAGVVAASAVQDDAPADVVEDENVETDDVDAALSQLDNILADDTAELETEPHTPEPIIEETTPMARAKKTDAIIDEVTETATAGAFASLTNVVEEKATVAERGDRIGDLVMEALQPMLKEWLDANLKGIVERAVTKEVKRISSGK